MLSPDKIGQFLNGLAAEFRAASESISVMLRSQAIRTLNLAALTLLRDV
jgi:hypothetical protein